MKIVERMIQEIYPGQNTALEDLDKRYDAIESTLGFPPKNGCGASVGHIKLVRS